MSRPGGRPRRALLVAHRLASPEATGIGRYVRELTCAVAVGADAAGWQVAVGSAPEREAAAWVPRGVAVHRLGRHRRLTHLSWTAAGRPALERLTSRADVVHVLSPFAPVPSRAPQVWTVHDTFPLDNPQWSGRIDGWAARRALDRIGAGDGPVITPTAAVARRATEVAGIDPARIRVVPEGVSAAFHTPPGRAERAALCRRYGVADGAYLLTLGAVTPRKNLTVVADALRGLRPGPNGPDLLVVGTVAPGGAATRAALETLGARVILAGYAPEADLPGLVAGARGVLHPARDEGFGLVALEAMAAGTPVLAGDVPAVAEVTGGAAELLDPDDDAAWGAAIDRLRTDDGRHGALAAAGRDRASAFTWERAAAATLAIYEEARR